MLFFSLEATVGDLDVASLTVKYKRASFIHEELTLGLICTGISETVAELTMNLLCLPLVI